MSQELQVIDTKKMAEMAKVVADSGLWSQFNSVPKVMGLMMLCQSDGIHPMHAVRHYDLIQGKPSKKSESQLADFYARGGKVQWLERTDKKCRAKFFSPNCPDGVEVEWTIEQAQKAGLTGKDNWRNYPRQMLSARVQAEGVQITDPGASLGMVVTEEALDMANTVTEKAAVVAFELVGDTETKGTEVVQMATATDYRVARGKLNQALLACETEKEFRAACGEFQGKHEKATWLELTGVKSGETFESLAKEHLDRIKSKTPRLKAWIAQVGEVIKSDELIIFFKAFENNAWLQNVDCEDALNAKAKEIGFENGLEDLRAMEEKAA